MLRDQRTGQVSFTAEKLASGFEVSKEQWFPIRTVTADSEVQVSQSKCAFVYACVSGECMM